MASPGDLGHQANQGMVDRLIAAGALWSAALVSAFRATPRHPFLDRVYQFSRRSEAWKAVAVSPGSAEVMRLVYSDRALITHLAPAGRAGNPVPISSSSQPSLMAQMLEDLHLSAGQRVLEIGAGTGYNAALLAHVAGPGQVTSIDVDRRVLAQAWEHLQAFPERGVQLRHADGREGFTDHAPYDRIMVTAATDDLEPAWLEQLAPDGLLLAPWSLAPGLAYTVRGTALGGVFHGRLTRAAYFMPLRSEDDSGTEPPERFPAVRELRSLPAPWAGWFDRRRLRLTWIGFSQALAFYAYIRGHDVHYRMLESGVPVFGISRDHPPALCWLGNREWQVNGEHGRDLGWDLWHAFLGAGGPWPTEFHLTATRRGDETPDALPECHVRQGPRYRQAWHLVEQRERPAWI